MLHLWRWGWFPSLPVLGAPPGFRKAPVLIELLLPSGKDEAIPADFTGDFFIFQTLYLFSSHLL